MRKAIIGMAATRSTAWETTMGTAPPVASVSSADPIAASAADEVVAPGVPMAENPRRRDGALHAALFAGLIAVLVVAPFLAYPVFVMRVMCFALFASAFNLLLGYGGLLSFGHAAYFGLASYVCAYAARSWGLDPAAAILLGTLAAGALGALFGAVAIRRQGIYFSMITLALAQIVYFVSLQAPFTGGEDGNPGRARAAGCSG